MLCQERGLCQSWVDVWVYHSSWGEGDFSPMAICQSSRNWGQPRLQLLGAPLKSFGGCTWGAWPVAWIIWQLWVLWLWHKRLLCPITIILLPPTSDSYTFESPLIVSSLLRRFPCSRLVPSWRTKIRGLGVPTHRSCLSAAAQLLELTFVRTTQERAAYISVTNAKFLIDIKNFMLESSCKIQQMASSAYNFRHIRYYHHYVLTTAICVLLDALVSKSPIRSNIAWVQLMACRLFGSNPLSEPKLAFCHFGFGFGLFYGFPGDHQPDATML